MAWNSARVVEMTSKAKGPRLSVSIAKRGQREPFVQVTMNVSAQELLFGGPIADKYLHVEIGTFEHVGKMRLVLSAAGGKFLAKKAMKGSVCLRLKPWFQVAEIQPPVSCKFEAAGESNTVIVTLPEWGQKEAINKSLSRELGIPRAGA